MELIAQTIVFGDEFVNNLDENLSMLRMAGFTGVEAGPLLLKDGSVDSVAGLLAKNELHLYAFHLGTNKIRDEDEVRRLCKVLNQLGCKNLICSGVLWGGPTRHYYERTGDLLRERSEEVASFGIRLHYHNHDWELNRVFGTQYGLQIIFENAHKDTGFVLDTFWVQAGGNDPTKLWERFKDRIRIIHLKDGRPGDLLFAPLGKGKCAVARYFTFFSKKDIDAIVWEQDLTHDRTIRQCIEISGSWLKGKWKDR